MGGTRLNKINDKEGRQTMVTHDKRYTSGFL